ncbi:hypothetical protein BD770DRAFT_396237 [Pilaira anomala]|nr:hypothetical protein BD770DRAFT_396237 [Pilaira anomala]
MYYCCFLLYYFLVYLICQYFAQVAQMLLKSFSLAYIFFVHNFVRFLLLLLLL